MVNRSLAKPTGLAPCEDEVVALGGGAADELCILDHDFNLLGYCELSPAAAGAASASGDAAELGAIVRAQSEANSANGGSAEVMWRGKKLRVLPMLGERPGYAVLIESDRRQDVVDRVAARYGLSAREFEVLASLVHGMTRAEIALALGIGERAVGEHLGKLGVKLGWLRWDETG